MAPTRLSSRRRVTALALALGATVILSPFGRQPGKRAARAQAPPHEISVNEVSVNEVSVNGIQAGLPGIERPRPGGPSGSPPGSEGGLDSGANPGSGPSGPSGEGPTGGPGSRPRPGGSGTTGAAPITLSCADPAFLPAADVSTLIAAAASAVDSPDLAVVAVDRLGRPLGSYLRGSAALDEQDRALGLARTGALFSNDQAPLSSRTVRFVSGVHFPPGIDRTPNAALYGIENTNRGCDLNVAYRAGKALPPNRSTLGETLDLRCDSGSALGCSQGPVTGKLDDDDSNPGGRPGTVPADPGGVPVFRDGSLVGGLGVVANDLAAAEFAAFSAVASGFLPDLTGELAPGVVFIDGIRLPFVETLERPSGVAAGPAIAPGSIAAIDGSCAPDGYLAGPFAGTNLATAEVDQIVHQAIAAAKRTRAVIRLPLGSRARMVIAVGDVDGSILALFRMPDATLFSVDVAVAKARNVVWFSGPGRVDLPGVPAGTAVTNRTISFGAQPFYPPGIGGRSGPFFDLYKLDRSRPCRQGSQSPNDNQNGIVFFPGSIPLYRSGEIVGGLGISGDGVEQDDYVAFLGGAGFRPEPSIWADRVFVDGVRLPFLKFPRNPEN